jgi:hypothetical protein
VTLSTHPALSLPCGRDERGMPFGLQVIGTLRGEAALLDAAARLEIVFAAQPETARARPDVDWLAQHPEPSLKSIVTHPPIWDLPASSTSVSSAV